MNSAANVCTAWVLANAKDSACCYLQTSADATTTAYFVDADKNSCTACNAVASSVKQMLRSKLPLTIVKLVLLVKPVLVELVPLVGWTSCRGLCGCWFFDLKLTLTSLLIIIQVVNIMLDLSLI